MQAFILTSPAFGEGQAIPSPYTCDGQDVSPPLVWTDPPAGTKSLALIADDPDAPGKTWVHWVLFNMPESLRGLPEAVPAERRLPDGSAQGVNDSGGIGYGGPCPPSGVHRYHFKLYALDAPLSLAAEATKRQVESAMNGHVLAQTQLVGIYQRAGKRTQA
jgi:Raf kinase inhibitor-like YbhB/YbcL family protein